MKRLFSVLGAALLVAIGLLGAQPPAPASAVDGADFDPGMIISDQLFYDGNAMSAAEIQRFLDQKIGTCSNGYCLNVTRVTSSGYKAWTSPSTGELACGDVAGGTMSAAEWIYRVQRACEISAKVILVTLQKEQGLVQGGTARSPGEWALKHAMGMACPDSGPCSDAYAGLATQIFTGTEQLKLYKAARFGRQPGEQFIRWSVNEACGGSWVDVRNYATAALYNYTPYQPNEAALANLYGTGDGCSQYGNRNFWVFYNDWFGPTVEIDGSQQLLDAVAAAGGSNGALGAVVTAENCAMGVLKCSQRHANGTVYWSSSTGAFAVLGKYDTAYRAAGGQNGVLGSPTSSYVDVPTSVNGAGGGQHFQGGTIYSSAAGVFAVPLPLRSAYWDAGGNGGAFGWPTSAQYCSGDACAQEFQGGLIAYSPTNGRYNVAAEYESIFRSSGGLTGTLGVPVAPKVPVNTPSNGGGSGQQFARGTIYTSTVGTFVVADQLRDLYWKLGGNAGSYGWPTAASDCAGAVCWQAFQGGYVFTNGRHVTADYVAPYAAAGGPKGVLGLPSGTRVTVASPNGQGAGQQFAKGTIYSSKAGAYYVFGPIRDVYWNAGGNAGRLGWPIANPVCADGVCTQAFQYGSIAQTSSSSAVAARAVHPAYADLYSTYSSQLGVPTTEYTVAAPNANGPGGAQGFQYGTVFESKAYGAFPVIEPIRSAYLAESANRGWLGWPIANPVCADGVCTQAFQYGSLTG